LKAVRRMDKNYFGIRGKVNDPCQYNLLDCQELEISRLQSSEIAEIKVDISEI
ncbi:9750_t:CDS:1, partial [Funneliformis caledonium]